MGLTGEIDKVVAKVQDVVDNVKRVTGEAAHRAEAKAEQARRNAAGDDLTTGQKIGSLLHQAKETVEADIDAFKSDTH